MDWQHAWDKALPYAGFLQVFGHEDQIDRWRTVYEQVSLTDEQTTLLRGFSRQMNVLCLAGVWCGDCSSQCPILQRFAETSDRIELRFLDREIEPEVRDELIINAGTRVPVAVFLSEDYRECGRYGDRTLSQYRRLASTLTGAACPTGNDIGNLLAQVTSEWLAELERIQLMLRLSPRLRAKHGD